MPAVSEPASTFARTGQPSYAGITNETYIGAERREPGTVTLKGDWRTERRYVELRRGTGAIILPFTGGEVNLVMQPPTSGRAAVTVSLDGKPVGESRGKDVGTDGIARFDRSGMIRLIAGAPRRRHVLTLSSSDVGLAPGFATVDVGVGYRLRRYEVRLDGHNLGDARDPISESELGDAQYYRMPARRVDVTLGVRF